MDSRLAPIFGRRSIRKYQDKPVDDATIKTILEAAMAAPSAVAKDPWRFVVVKDKAVLAKIAEGLPSGKMIAHAGFGLVVCGDLEKAHDQQLSYMIQDCTAAIENVLLSVHMLGLGAVWLGVHPREERVKHLKEVLGIPDPVIPISALAIGYPAEEKEARTRYNEESVHWDRW